MKQVILCIVIFAASFSHAGLTRKQMRDRISASIVPDSAFSACASVVKDFQNHGDSFSVAAKVNLWATIDTNEMATIKVNPSWDVLYEFSLTGTNYEDCLIRAGSKIGWRSFLFDPRWNIVRLEFRSKDDKRLLADWVKRFYEGTLSEIERQALLALVPVPEAFIVPDNEADKCSIAGYVGDFLFLPDMEATVFSVAFGTSSSCIHENALRSILSCYSAFPNDTKQKIVQKGLERLKWLESNTAKENITDEISLIKALVSGGVRPDSSVKK